MLTSLGWVLWHGAISFIQRSLVLTLQNTFDQESNTVKQFWQIFGAATGSLIGIVIVLITLAAKNGQELHHYATTLFGTGKSRMVKPSEPGSDIEEPDTGAPIATLTGKITAKPRRRKPPGVDVEQAGGNDMEMAERDNGNRRSGGTDRGR
jgi:hypothetical protein